MTTFGWSYNADDRPDSSAPAPVPMDQETRKRLHPQNHGPPEGGTDKRARTDIACRIFIGSVPLQIDEKRLYEYFKVFGNVEEALIMRDSNGDHKGFGFVSYSDAESAKEAVTWCKQNYSRLGGKRIYVDHAVRRKTPQEYQEILEQKERERQQRAMDAGDVKLQPFKWEYKWKNTPEAKVYGPFKTDQMIEWEEKGFFKGKGVFVRQIGNGEYDTEFEPSTEVDFSMFP